MQKNNYKHFLEFAVKSQKVIFYIHFALLLGNPADVDVNIGVDLDADLDI